MSVWLLVLIPVVAVEACEVQYTGAVLELEPYSSWEAGGTAILQQNARLFLEYASLAKQQVSYWEVDADLDAWVLKVAFIDAYIREGTTNGQE